MKLYPAIDILGGSAVRLVQGEFDRPTQYAEDPLHAALAWREAGAKRLHVVDLDGARAGQPQNLEHVSRIASESGLPVQLGGGLRTIDAMRQAVQAGAQRLVLGTAAWTSLLEQALDCELEDKLVVAIDVRHGLVATAGWTKTGTLTAVEAAHELQGRGAKHFAYTDVDRDGMLEGGDLEGVRDVAGALGNGTSLIYSGGIGTLADLEALSGLGEPRLDGVIVGKALYERRFSIAEATAALCT